MLSTKSSGDPRQTALKERSLMSSMSSKFVVAVCGALLIAAGVRGAAQTSTVPTYSFEVNDPPACQTRTLVSTGGAFPKNPHTLVLRWAGYGNYEMVYNGQVIL